MEATKYIWMNGSLVPWAEAKVHVLAHSLHYGDGVFEGVRVYKTSKGSAIFRLAEHLDRFRYSAEAIDINIPFPNDVLSDAVVHLLREIGLEQGYIRPLAIHGYGVMGVNPRSSPVDVVIAAWPWGAYLPVDAVDIKVSNYIRIHPRSTVADAKICGHYVNSVLAVLELKGTKYHEALFLDDQGNIAEGPGENFFVVKNGTIATPPLGTILPGITRSTAIQIAQELGYPLVERTVTLQEALEADEAFFTGTAAEITPINSIDDRVIGDGKNRPIALKIRERYLDVVYGRCLESHPHYNKYLTFV